MIDGYEPVIGLEIHVEQNTSSKMFCYCSTDYFGKTPNTHTCPVCLGLPGAVPIVNKKAVENCIKVGLALNCAIREHSLFERKNYFYPDLPKGYQISQYRWPLCESGSIEATNEGGEAIKIRITRVHQEEDTGKLAHIDGKTTIDFNRSGVPLIEIVTEPDFSDTGAVREYAQKLQQILRYIGVSDADMEKGQLRLEANVSVRKAGETVLPPYRVELKNINSFRFMADAIEYEINRQIEVLKQGGKLTQHTRGWNEAKKETFLQREKEEAHDYRYFPDPDLPPMRIEKSWVNEIKSSLPELPDQKRNRFMDQYGINKAQAVVLSDNVDIAEYFEKAVELGQKQQIEPVKVANYIINQKVDILKIAPEEVASIVLSKSIGIISSEEELEKIVKEAIDQNPKAVEDYKSGKAAAMQVLIGVVMRLSKGKADISKVSEIFKKLL